MKDIILILCLVLMAVSGYFIMDKLDKFLSANCTAVKKSGKAVKPYTVLRDSSNRDTIKNEIEIFLRTHPRACVIMYDPKECGFFVIDELIDA